MRDLAREQLLTELRALKPVFEREGVVHLSMFGSRARGDNRPDSDVDLVVDVEKGRKFSGLDLAGIYGLIEDQLGLESSLIVLDKYTDPRFVAKIERDLVPVF